jgi:hypothetical protein
MEKIDLSKLPANEARVLVAKDALEHLGAGVLIPEKGTYLSADLSFFNDAEEGIQQSGPCRVCALGAAAVSFVLRDAKKHSGEEINYSDEMRDTLSPIFPKKMLSDMEDIFEDFGILYKDDRRHQRAHDHYPDFFAKYPTAEDRMRAIFQNIIDNNGEFCP